jgi:hypothetical protein
VSLLWPERPKQASQGEQQKSQRCRRGWMSGNFTRESRKDLANCANSSPKSIDARTNKNKLLLLSFSPAMV